MNRWLCPSNPPFAQNKELAPSVALHFSAPPHSPFPKPLQHGSSGVRHPRAHSEDTKCLARGSWNALVLLERPGAPREWPDALSAPNASAPLIWFQKQVTWGPSRNHLLYPGKAQSARSSVLSQVSSHPQRLGSLSTHLRRLHLHLFQSESGEQTEPLQRKPEHESLRCFPTIFSLLILAEDELFRVSEPFMPTQVLKKRHFPLWLIDQLTGSPALSLWARSGENASFYLSSFRDINQLPAGSAPRGRHLSLR